MLNHKCMYPQFCLKNALNILKLKVDYLFKKKNFCFRFEVEGKPCTLEFTDALQTVMLNGRSFRVEFGGLPKPVIIDEKKHFIRFSVLPRGIRAGHVKITGMRGDQPNETSAVSVYQQQKTVGTCSVTTQATNSQPVSTTTSSSTTSSTSINKTNVSNFNVPPGLDLDSTSQDGMDPSSSTKSTGKNFQLIKMHKFFLHLIKY